LGLSYQINELVIWHLFRLVSYKVEKIDDIIWFVLILSFRRVLYVVCFLSGISLASEV